MGSRVKGEPWGTKTLPRGMVIPTRGGGVDCEEPIFRVVVEERSDGTMLGYGREVFLPHRLER